jgi:methylenetetrahydrofolate reductase (NADPH)
MLLEVLPPLDYEKVGTETWGEVAGQIKKMGVTSFFKNVLSKNKEKKAAAMDTVFKTIRQPVWWGGDSEYHAPGYSKPASELERKLLAGEFVVTAEVTPPASAKTDKLVSDIEIVRPYVTAVNFTDSSSARPRMSSISCSHVAHKQNVEPVLQIAARDTTRTRLQSDIIGINELGVKNVLCITGDSPVIGLSPTGSMNIIDIDSIQMLWILRRMRDDAVYLDGRRIKSPPILFLGASSSPFASDPALQAIRDHKKVNAGAQFIQTNLIFEPDRLDAWLEQLDKRNVLD